jgi:hypothetical protein
LKYLLLIRAEKSRTIKELSDDDKKQYETEQKSKPETNFTTQRINIRIL